MAHPCIICGSDCDCRGSLDDAVVDKTPSNCLGCGCKQFAEDQGWEDDDYDDDYRFIPCDKCDGHDACVDFGCAFELGLGKLVKNNI